MTVGKTVDNKHRHTWHACRRHTRVHKARYAEFQNTFITREATPGIAHLVLLCWTAAAAVLPTHTQARVLLKTRRALVIRTHQTHKNLYITVFLLSIFGPDYSVPPQQLHRGFTGARNSNKQVLQVPRSSSPPRCFVGAASLFWDMRGTRRAVSLFFFCFYGGTF